MRSHRYIVQIVLYTLVILQLCLSNLRAQDSPSNVDLSISLVTELPVIKINGVFAVEARVSLEQNSSTIPLGRLSVRIELLGPDNITIDSYEQAWSGFTHNTDGWLENDPLRVPNKVLFQIPWSQADNWNDTAEWKIIIQVFGGSVESDLGNNKIERSFPIVVPDLFLQSRRYQR